MRKLFLLPFLLVSLAACGERRAPEPQPAPADTTPLAGPEPVEAPPRDTGFNPRNVENFEKVVHMEYAHIGTQVPRRALDSIIRANATGGGSMRIEDEMNKYMRRHDTLARRALADKYGISLDSLNAILAKDRLGK